MMRGAVLALLLGLPGPAAAGQKWPDRPRNYAAVCGPCHTGRGFAVQVLADRLGKEQALLTNRRDLDADVLRLAVRNGVGAMPPMSRVEVSDAELDAIIRKLMAR